MRIVFLVKRFWPATGGVEKYVAELAINLGAFLRTLLVECTRRVA